MLFSSDHIDYKFRYCLATILCVFLTNIVSTRGSSSTRVKYEGNDVVLEGNPFTITCQISAFDSVKWQKDGHNIAFDTLPGDGYTFRDTYNNYTMSREEADGKVLVKLSVPHAHPYHTGNYRCNTFHINSHHLLVLSGVALKPNYDFEAYKVFEYKQAKLILSCGNATDSKLEWFKDNDPIKESERFKLEGQSLSIDKPTDQDVGKYRCVNTTSNSSETIEVISRPYVKLPENTVVVEGETLILDCTTTTGYPAPTIVWKIGDTLYNESRENVELLPNKEGLKNAVLKIKDVTMNDRNTYTCIPSNVGNYDNSTSPRASTTLVRVKDKLAALWPFLGICVEVLVLCAIILIYEKKRNKAELEESDTDNSPEQKNTPDHGKDSVRHRK